MRAFELLPIILRNPDALVYVEEVDLTHQVARGHLRQVQYTSLPYAGHLGDPLDSLASDPNPGPKLIFHTTNDNGHSAYEKNCPDRAGDPDRNIFGYVDQRVATEILVEGQPRSLGTPSAVSEILLKAFELLTRPFPVLRFHLFSGDTVDVTAEKLTILAKSDDTTAELSYDSDSDAGSVAGVAHPKA